MLFVMRYKRYNEFGVEIPQLVKGNSNRSRKITHFYNHCNYRGRCKILHCPGSDQPFQKEVQFAIV